MKRLAQFMKKCNGLLLIAQIIGRKVGLSEDELEDLKRASEIYKFDLVTNMVGEFPELQGIMGCLITRRKPAVATAIREHYLPTPVKVNCQKQQSGLFLALADKLDSVFSFFSVGMIPTGSNDPYALRRQTYGVIRIIEDKGWTFPLVQLQTEVDEAVNQDVEKYGVLLNEGQAEVVE